MFVLGAVAAAIGLAASQAVFNWIDATVTEMPFWVDFRMSPLTVTFVVAITLLASAVGGVLPALRATRRDPSSALSATSRRVTHGFGLGGSAMVAAQIALSIAALQAALVVARGVAGYRQGSPTPMASQVLTATVYAAEPLDAREAQSKVIEAVGRLASVRHVALSTSLPRLSPPTLMTIVRSGPGGAESSPRPAPAVSVSPQFFETLGGGAVSGRVFTANDLSPAAVPIAIVNQPFAEKFFAGRNPIGQQLRIVDPDAPDAAQWREIVGVAPDLGLSSGDSEMAAGFYLPLDAERRFHVSLRSATDPAPLAHALQRAVADADPRLQVDDIRPLEDVGSEDRAVFAGIGGALTGLGGMSLLLSVIGVYAMLSFSVTQRTREIAVRTALGATRSQILRTLLARSAVPFAVGTLLGPLLGSALVAARGIFAFRLPADAGPWGGPLLCALMIAAGLLAALVPGRRALGINTAEALKGD